MSVDTNLLVNAKYGLETISDILKSMGMSFDKNGYGIKPTQSPDYTIILFTTPAGNDRQLNCHRMNSPLGPALLLSFGANEEGNAILLSIADRIGGFYRENDCDSSNWEQIDGKLSESNGLPYFLKDMIVSGYGDELDYKKLKTHIELWCKRVRYGSKIRF